MCLINISIMQYASFQQMISFSCNSRLNKEKEIENLIMRWEGRTIQFPKSSVFSILGVLPAGMSRSAQMVAIVSGAWVCSVHYGWKGKWRIVWQKHRARVIGVAVLVCICLMIGQSL